MCKSGDIKYNTLSLNASLIHGIKPIIYNVYYFADLCQFDYCYLPDGAKPGVAVGITNNEEECARLVKEKYPGAYGATRYSPTYCEAEFSTAIVKNSNYRCCVFGNISSNVIFL